MRTAYSSVLGIAGVLLIALPAAAQTSPLIGAEAATEEVRRGLSWSEGRAAISADVFTSMGSLDASARVVTTRSSDRHDGAWSVADLKLGTRQDVGAIQVRAAATAHLFVGANSAMDYLELGASASYVYGPVQMSGGAEWAPSQSAIGGSNLYLYTIADAGIPGTPFTVIAGLGHSTGSVDDAIRAQRLRPGGNYLDWQVGLEHRRGPLTIAVEYRGTDVSNRATVGRFADLSNAGDRLVGRVRFAL